MVQNKLITATHLTTREPYLANHTGKISFMKEDNRRLQAMEYLKMEEGKNIQPSNLPIITKVVMYGEDSIKGLEVFYDFDRVGEKSGIEDRHVFGTFELKEGDSIVKVSGNKADEKITRLCFETSKGHKFPFDENGVETDFNFAPSQGKILSMLRISIHDGKPTIEALFSEPVSTAQKVYVLSGSYLESFCAGSEANVLIDRTVDALNSFAKDMRTQEVILIGDFFESLRKKLSQHEQAIAQDTPELLDMFANEGQKTKLEKAFQGLLKREHSPVKVVYITGEDNYGYVKEKLEGYFSGITVVHKVYKKHKAYFTCKPKDDLLTEYFENELKEIKKYPKLFVSRSVCKNKWTGVDKRLSDKDLEALYRDALESIIKEVFEGFLDVSYFLGADNIDRGHNVEEAEPLDEIIKKLAVLLPKHFIKKDIKKGWKEITDYLVKYHAEKGNISTLIVDCEQEIYNPKVLNGNSKYCYNVGKFPGALMATISSGSTLSDLTWLNYELKPEDTKQAASRLARLTTAAGKC